MARYRYRFQTIPLSSLGSGRRQINTKGCWRVQFTLNGGQVPFYINGVKLPTGQWLNPEFFDYAIQLELKKAGVAPTASAAAPQKAGGE